MLFSAEGKWVDIEQINCREEFSQVENQIECELHKKLI